MIAVTLSRAILSASLAPLLSVFDSNFSPISSIPRRPTEGKDIGPGKITESIVHEFIVGVQS